MKFYNTEKNSVLKSSFIRRKFYFIITIFLKIIIYNIINVGYIMFFYIVKNNIKKYLKIFGLKI